MGKSAGIITINLNAGTAAFVRDMAGANAAVKNFGGGVREMGSHGVSEMRATAAGVKLIEGSFLSNSRAVDGFLEKVLHLGPVMQAAFPLVGGLALIGMFTKMGEEASEFFTKMREAPDKSAAAFRELNLPIKTVNDSLELTNAKLENQIAKLEGRRQNTLKVALLEARDAADKLAESLNKDIAALQKALKENEVGSFKGFLTGKGSTSDIGEQVGKLAREESDIRRSGQARIDSAVETNDTAAVQAATQELNNRLLAFYNRELDETNKKLAEVQKLSVPSTRTRGGGRPTPEGEVNNKATTDFEIRRQQLLDLRDNLEQQMRSVPLSATEANLKGKVASAEDAKEQAANAAKYSDKINKLNADLAAATAKMDAIGQGEAAKVLAKSNGEAIKSIEEINKSWEAQHRVVTDAEAAHIREIQLKLAATESEEAWRTKLAQTTDQIREQVRGQEALTSAVGKGYEAVRAANIENELMSKIGFAAYIDPANKSGVDITRQNIAAAFDSRHANQQADEAQTLREQITLEIRLSQVQMQGAEAVRLATLDVTLAKLREKGASQEVLDLTIRRSELERDAAVNKELQNINLKIEATKRLAAAQIQGSAAVRQAVLANTIAELQNKPGGASNAAIDAARLESEAQEQLRISTIVANRVNLHAKQLSDLQEEADALNSMAVTEDNRLAITRASREIENERLHILSEQALAMGTARDGVRAFFLDMQADGKKTAQTVYEALNSAFDAVATNAAKSMTGQKTAWKQAFQGIAEQIAKDQVKSNLQGALRSVGARFPGLSGITGSLAGKPDGTRSNPIWVQQSGGSGPAIPGIPVGFGGPGGTFGGGSQGGVIFSLLDKLRPAGGNSEDGGGSQGGGFFSLLGSLLTPRADGGDVSAGSSYLIGERGPELFRAASSGSIYSNSQSKNMDLGGHHVHIGNIDARGSDEARIRRDVALAVQAGYEAAVGKSPQVHHDLMRRTPAGRT